MRLRSKPSDFSRAMAAALSVALSVGWRDSSQKYRPSERSMIAQAPLSARSMIQYSWLISPPSTPSFILAFAQLGSTWPLTFITCAGPSGAPLWHVWVTENEPDAQPEKSLVEAWQSACILFWV